MPPAILYDSEDDDEEIIVPAQDTIDLVANFPSVSQSTGSTERLKRQLRDAHDSLCLPSGVEMASSDVDPMRARASLGSPAPRPSKRRHTEVTSEPSIQWSPEKTSKRTKTMATYGKKHALTATPLREVTANLPGQPTISGSVRFSDHSGVDESHDLPMGSLEADFAEHEPAVMFRDSGSTIAFNESSHDRLVQEALRSRGANDTSVACHTASDEQSKSSPFPWSASAQTNATKTPQAPTQSAVANLANDPNMMSRILEALGTARPPADVSAAAVISTDNDNGPSATPETAQLPAQGLRLSSPVVQINVNESKLSGLEVQPIASPPKAERGRRRKTQEPSSEALNSEDVAIGLPKERYQPRPSKRRATQVPEPLIDLSAVPGKAAKSKRRKTANADLAGTASTDSAPRQDLPAPVGRTAKRKASSKATISAETVVDDDDDEDEPVVQASKQEITIAQTDAMPTPDTSTAMLPPQVKPSPTPSQASQSRSDDGVFTKPAPKIKAPSKARRSHTTIYEDHVAFKSKDKTPTLSQQQAKRKSALKPVEPEPKATSNRGASKRVISDDEDDEADELTIAPESEEPQQSNGKGKKARAPADGPPNVLVAEETTTVAAPADDVDLAVDEAPKKRGRGRPAKAKPLPDDSLKSAALDAVDEDDEGANAEAHSSKTVEDPSAIAKAPASSPPDKPVASKKPAAPAATPVKPLPGKNSPISHSPIEKSSAVPLRVGLSKMKRIPSLLKVMRPPPQRVEPKSKGRKIIVEE